MEKTLLAKTFDLPECDNFKKLGDFDTLDVTYLASKINLDELETKNLLLFEMITKCTELYQNKRDEVFGKIIILEAKVKDAVNFSEVVDYEKLEKLQNSLSNANDALCKIDSKLDDLDNLIGGCVDTDAAKEHRIFYDEKGDEHSTISGTIVNAFLGAYMGLPNLNKLAMKNLTEKAGIYKQIAYKGKADAGCQVAWRNFNMATHNFFNLYKVNDNAFIHLNNAEIAILADLLCLIKVEKVVLKSRKTAYTLTEAAGSCQTMCLYLVSKICGIKLDTLTKKEDTKKAGKKLKF